MRYDFSTDIRDEETGCILHYDVECELEISLDTDGCTPVVDAVWLNGQSLMQSPDQLSQMLGHRIEAKASGELLAEGPLYQKVIEQEGVFAERAVRAPYFGRRL